MLKANRLVRNGTINHEKVLMGLVVSASDDQTLRIWKMYKPNNPQGVPTHNGEATWKSICTLSGFHDRCIYSVSWSKVNNYIASVSGDNSIRIFEKVITSNRLQTVLV